MVASIPLAIEIVTTTTLALGSKELSAHGAIVARLAAIEDMAGKAILWSDKAGTLTLNQMVIQEETPTYKAGQTQYSLLRYGATSVAAEQLSSISSAGCTSPVEEQLSSDNSARCKAISFSKFWICEESLAIRRLYSSEV